jgi:hypothetical protein
MTSQLPQHWERMYGHPVYFAETFIDPSRFRGTLKLFLENESGCRRPGFRDHPGSAGLEGWRPPTRSLS